MDAAVCVVTRGGNRAFHRPPAHAPAFLLSEPASAETEPSRPTAAEGAINTTTDCALSGQRHRAHARSMSDLATVEHQAAPPAPKPVKERRISKRMQQALEHLATKGVTQREAASRAGISEFHLSRELRKPQIQAFIARRAAENIARGVWRASTRMVELVDAESEHVAAKVSERLLEHGGILRPQASGTNVNVSINNNMSAGYVIDLTPWQPLNAAQQVDAPGRSVHTTPSQINDLVPVERS